jgi:hypothetical protein
VKSSFPIRCKCGHEIVLETTGTKPFKDTSCPKCHAAIWIVDNGFVSTRIFNKSLEQLNSGDFTLAIIFSAMAIECELARVFVKWKQVDLMATRMPASADEASWDAELRAWVQIAVRLDAVCKFLTGDTFDVLLAKQSKLSAAVRKKHPDSVNYASAKKFFEEHLFWKRNAIVHLGKIDFAQSDAEGCLHTAETLLQIISEMDFLRLKSLDAASQQTP